MSMNSYSFVVAHSASGANTELSKVYPDIKCWISDRGGAKRSGGNSGKVINFNEGKYLQDLASGKLDSIELYSERRWDKGEVSEILNCDFSAIFSSGTGLMLSANEEKFKLDELVCSFLAMERVAENFNYAYGYVESQAYGTGYARGIYMPDNSHPLMWSRRSEAGAWLKRQWSNDTDCFIRDIYQFNAYSNRKIETLPEDRKQALTHAMARLGECTVQKGFSVWTLDKAELEKARDYLKGLNLLVSYIK